MITVGRAALAETIARRYAALPRNQRTLDKGLRQFAQLFRKNHMNNRSENLTRPIEVNQEIHSRISRCSAFGGGRCAITSPG
jgi:hypothetical protein